MKVATKYYSGMTEENHCLKLVLEVLMKLGSIRRHYKFERW